MPSFDDYIVYVDESGDHGLSSIDPDYPAFVLAFCLFEKEVYARRVTTQITDLKFKYFGHDQVILREREIRKQKGLFRILFDEEVRTGFMEDISQVVEEAPFTLLAAAIDKRELIGQHDEPRNPYHIALGSGLERLYFHLSEEIGCEGGRLHVVFERRGQKEDDNLELEFRRVVGGGRPEEHLPFEIVFSSKKSNSAGLQLADLVARPIGRHLLRPDQPNRAYDIVEKKFRRGPDEELEDWGLEVFP